MRAGPNSDASGGTSTAGIAIASGATGAGSGATGTGSGATGATGAGSGVGINMGTGEGGGALNRRDADLLSVVRRLEASVSTLDVNARMCLRDALVSLCNKASNPALQQTPQQEAMNRAAEYLVLRMLFLSGHQVMHTAPGTGGGYVETPVVTPSLPQQHQQASNAPGSVSGSGLGQRVNGGQALRVGLSPAPQTSSPTSSAALLHNRLANTNAGLTPPSLARNAQPQDDGTVAASTGTDNAAVAQPDDVHMRLQAVDFRNGDDDKGEEDNGT